MSSPSLAEEDETSLKDYLVSLRSNRNELVDGILATNKDPEELSQKKRLLTKAKNIQNQTRGKLGELLGRVALTQQTSATDEDLVTYYKISDAFVMMSEHEGFCVPVLEAFYSKLPVIAFDAGAVGETMRGGGVLLDKKDNRVASIILRT